MKLKTLLTIGLLSFSTVSMSAGVMKEMFQMKQQLNILAKTDNIADFQTKADELITITEQAKNTMPASLEGDETRFKGYQAGMQEVIDVIKQATQEAKAGKLNEAKVILKQLDEMKRTYHKEYK